MEWSTTSIQVDTPQFSQKPAALTQKNLKLPRWNSNIWNLPVLSAVQHHHGCPLCTWFPKKTGLGGLVVITVTLICQTCESCKWLSWSHNFFKIDLVKGYHKILVAAEDIPPPKKTAIIMPSGLFEYLFTPFGLSNAGQTFQPMMD
jgi:hypothetical protein